MFESNIPSFIICKYNACYNNIICQRILLVQFLCSLSFCGFLQLSDQIKFESNLGENFISNFCGKFHMHYPKLLRFACLSNHNVCSDSEALFPSNGGKKDDVLWHWAIFLPRNLKMLAVIVIIKRHNCQTN